MRTGSWRSKVSLAIGWSENLPVPLRLAIIPRGEIIQRIFGVVVALLHDSTAARVGALFQLLVQDTTAQDFGLPSSAIRLRM